MSGTASAEQTMPYDQRILAQLFAPTAIAVVTAVIAARISYSIGRRLSEAREMGSYRLLERLGQGGMGEVWRAEHKMLARPAAIKLIRPDALAGGAQSAGQEMLRRFEREAQATALLESEYTIEVYDFGISSDGSFYYVMELIEGSAQIDGRADLYAVGCVAYWLISGRLVFEAESAMKMIVSHASAEPPRLSERTEQVIPLALEEIVHSCLKKDPADRPQSARELAERLAAVDLARAWDQQRARQWWLENLPGSRRGEPVDPLEPTAPVL